MNNATCINCEWKDRNRDGVTFCRWKEIELEEDHLDEVINCGRYQFDRTLIENKDTAKPIAIVDDTNANQSECESYGMNSGCDLGCPLLNRGGCTSGIEFIHGLYDQGEMDDNERYSMLKAYTNTHQLTPKPCNNRQN